MSAVETAPRRSESRDPETLKREADAIRADLDRTLDALEHKLSPREIMDRSLGFARERGGEMLQKVGVTAAKHPIPFLLASAGALWLASSRRKATARSRAQSLAYRYGDFDRSTHSLPASGMNNPTAAMKEHAAQTLDATRERTVETGRHLSHMVRKRPVVYGALAVAVGAAVGAALPATRYERGLVARARDSIGPLIERAVDAWSHRAGVSGRKFG
jgi:hypothetical protein